MDVNCTDDVFHSNNIVLHRVKFAIMFILSIPAAILSLIIFVFFVTNRSTLKSSHNQSLLILLVVNFIQIMFEIPFFLNYYIQDHINPATSIYCTSWTFIDYTLCATNEWLMATISIQRHILIFHGNILRVSMLRILVNYLPIIICLIYPALFYLFAIILYPCDGTQWDFNEKLCGLGNCYLLFDPVLGAFDWAFNNGAPIFITTFANIALFTRIVLQKRRFNSLFTWDRQRRMAKQLFSVAILYIIAWTPCVVIALIQTLGDRDFLADIQTNYLLDLNYLTCFLFPYICLSHLPKLSQMMIKFFYRRPSIVPA